MSVIELAHGIERADTIERRAARERFLDELLNEITPEPVTVPIAFRAGRLDGSLQGNRDTDRARRFADWGHCPGTWIRAATHNVRHFQMIPNLVAKQL